MFSVSEAYLEKMFDQVQTHDLVGTVDDIPFDSHDVIGVSYTNRCSDKKVNLGSVNIGTLKLTFLTNILDRGDFYGKKITISDKLLVGYDDNDDPIFEAVPMGEFYISEATWRGASMVDVTAYDVLSMLDKPLEIDQTSGKLYNFCQYIETQTGAPCGMTEAECDAMVNGDVIIAPYFQNDMTTYRDLLSCLAAFVGGFAYADRSGKWRFKSFGNTSILSISENRRFSGTKISDFTTRFDCLTYIDIQDNERVIYVGDSEGFAMNLGANPFLQYGTQNLIRANNIFNVVQNMTYTPFEVSLLPAFAALDLGDVISFTNDYTGETSTGAVMQMTWTYNKSVKVDCFGSNPNLRDGKNAQDNSISGLNKKSTTNEVTFYTFENINDIMFGSEQEVTIATLYFVASQQTTVKIMHEFIFDMIKDLMVRGGYEVRYYYDGTLVNYSPYESLTGIVAKTEVPIVPDEGEEGETEPVEAEIEPVEVSITRDFFYILKNVTPNIRHSWEVRIVAHGIETVQIQTNHAHITLEGQRLYGESHFNGFINAEDGLVAIPFDALSVCGFTESSSIGFVDGVIMNPSENVTLIDVGGLSPVVIAEGSGVLSPHVYMDGGFFITAENGLILCAESGERFITE